MFVISHAVQNEKLWNLHTKYKVIGKVLALGLLVVVYKIPYNSCVNQARCNWCVPIVLLSIWYNVCACHSPVYRYIAATTVVVHLVQCIIAARVVVV